MSKNLFIRQWRKFRGMKLQTLSTVTGLSISTLSQIETGKRGYSRRSLEACAAALGCPPGYLLRFDPFENPDFWHVWDGIPEADRRRHAHEAMIAILIEATALD